MIGKKDFFSVTKKEIELSDKTDQTQYDVIRRVFALGAKLRNTKEYERRAAKSLEILEKIGGAK
jgi:hypothetical protein